MELLHSFLHIFSSEGLRQLIQTGGLVAICLIIFAETGFFALLPGDSLLVLCGIFAATPDPITGQPLLPLAWLLTLVPVSSMISRARMILCLSFRVIVSA
jgi:membrane protein DedA with SNARE-associated domain